MYLIALMTMIPPALAIEPEPAMRYNSPDATAGAVAAAGAAATARVRTSQTSTLSTGPATATSAPSSATLTINEAPAPSPPRTTTLRNVPDLSLSNVAPTAPCIVAFTGGLSLAGGAIGFGGGKEDINCSLRETARSFAGLGLTRDAIAVLCTSEHAATAPTCMELRARKLDEDIANQR
jgi:hypothetical protein